MGLAFVGGAAVVRLMRINGVGKCTGLRYRRRLLMDGMRCRRVGGGSRSRRGHLPRSIVVGSRRKSRECESKLIDRAAPPPPPPQRSTAKFIAKAGQRIALAPLHCGLLAPSRGLQVLRNTASPTTSAGPATRKQAGRRRRRRRPLAVPRAAGRARRPGPRLAPTHGEDDHRLSTAPTTATCQGDPQLLF
jgi:hypothetical protein